MYRFHPLSLAATHARAVLVAGLIIGIALPGLARFLAGWIPEMVMALLFLGALRLSPADLRPLGTDLPGALARVLALQLALPLALLTVAYVTGTQSALPILALVLLACAPPIVSSPNIAAIMGLSAPVAMQHMVIGSVLLPLTALPLFWLMPALSSADAVLAAVLRLLVAIALAGGGAILLRHLLPVPGPRTLRHLDGLSVLALAVFVIGLMPSVSSAITQDTAGFAYWLAIAFAANFGTQAVALCLSRHRAAPHVAGARALVAGNRNISLFFVALPPDITAPMLVFLGCYQLPMLLTPVLLHRLYTR